MQARMARARGERIILVGDEEKEEGKKGENPG